MFVYRGIGTRLLLVAGLMACLAGCPLKGDNGLTLILTPEVLNFEAETDMLTFQVHRNLTNAPVEPVVVSSSQPWIIPEVCSAASDNCLGHGIVDKLFIPIRVDRNKMLLGTNRGEIIVRTGGAADRKLTVYAEDVLFIDFRVSNRRPAVGQAVSFQDASEKTDAAGDVVARLWDFGDGTTSTATDPFHVYNAPGLYSVSLTVTTANGEESTRKAAWITVGNPAPNVDFEASRTNIFEGDSIVFTNVSVPQTEPVTELLWDFGDGRTSTDIRPEHQYTAPGVYTVTLTVKTANTIGEEKKTNFVIVQRKVAPDARIAVNPSNPVARSQARFSDVSERGSAAIQQWFWDFGDGTTSRLQNPTHTFEQGGDYQVSLYVVSAHGSDTITQTVTVVTIPPTASFTVSDRTPFILTEVAFTDTSQAGSAPIDEYLWEFGDSSSSTEQNPTHTYNSAGTFEVRLTAVSEHGSNTATATVTVSFMPPTAQFSATPLSPNVGQAVQFMDQSTPGTAAVNQWLWNFGDPDSGDANISISQNPTHTYNAPGFYTVTLTVRTPVSMDNADTIVKQAYIQAVQAPAPAFTSSADVNSPDIVQFTNMTLPGSEPITSYLWNFGDPNSVVNTSTAQNPTHQFSTAGTFTVTLTVQTATREVTVSQPVTVTFIAPVAAFEVETTAATPRTGVLDDGALTIDTLQFINMMTLGTEMDTSTFEYLWDFGDGNTSEMEEPTHQYVNEGTYTVTFTITTPTSTAQVSHDIGVDVAPVPDFSALPQIANRGTEIQFFDQSTTSVGQTIDSYLWLFGNGTVAASRDATHRYSDRGQYNITLTLGFTHEVTGAPLTVSLTKSQYIQIN